jgi:hypothetical protein
MRRITIFGIFLIMSLASYVSAQENQGVVLPVDQAPNLMKQCSRKSISDASAYWTPSAEEIRKLESALLSFLNEQQALKYASAYRQYVGFKRGEHKFIYLNAFPKPQDERWKTAAVLVCDGGAAFYGAEYDVERNQILEIDFNGPFVPGQKTSLYNSAR